MRRMRWAFEDYILDPVVEYVIEPVGLALAWIARHVWSGLKWAGRQWMVFSEAAPTHSKRQFAAMLGAWWAIALIGLMLGFMYGDGWHVVVKTVYSSGCVLAAWGLVKWATGQLVSTVETRQERAGHNDRDYNCVYWWGDRGGYNHLAERCLTCNPKPVDVPPDPQWRPPQWRMISEEWLTDGDRAQRLADLTREMLELQARENRRRR